MIPMRGSDDEKLDSLFRAYAACATPEANVNFMPDLWRKIEARQTFTFSFRRVANAFVTAALALTVALGVYTAMPHPANPVSTQSYLEVLADAHPIVTPELLSPARMDLTDSAR